MFYLNAKGFSMIEVIVAIAILGFAILGTFILIQQSLIGASLNRSQLTAYYLAQEGIEIIRNIRDTNWLQRKENWDDGISFSEEIIDNKFVRTTTINKPENDLLEVEVVVAWNERGKDYSVKAINYLYNWYER